MSTSQRPVPLLGLRTAIYVVPDLAAARDWYAGAIGAAPYFDEPFYVGFDVEGFELGLIPAGDARVSGAGGTHAYWGVGDVDAAVARLIGRGARVHEAPRDVGGGIRTALVCDPWGNLVGLIDKPHFTAARPESGTDSATTS